MLSTALRVADALPSNWKRPAADHDPDNGENRARAGRVRKETKIQLSSCEGCDGL